MTTERGDSMSEQISLHDPAILEGKAAKLVRQNQPKLYKSMTKAELTEYCERKAKRAKEYAENLMQVGIWEEEAWNRAIRLEILESESD